MFIKNGDLNPISIVKSEDIEKEVAANGKKNLKKIRCAAKGKVGDVEEKK